MKRLVLIMFIFLFLCIVLIGGIFYYLLIYRTPGAYFDSGGVRIYYTDEGAGPPVVLVHGFAVHADFNWRRAGIADALAREFRVITLDLRGHGLSGKPHEPEAYGTEMAEDIVRLMDHLKIEKAHVVGYSLGGFLTLKLATMHPERLLSAAPLAGGWEKPEDSTFLARIPELVSDLEAERGVKPPSGMFGEDRARTGFIHTWSIKLITRMLNDGHALGAMMRSADKLTVTEQDLGNISIPMLSIAGTRDPLKVGVENLRGAVPGIEVVLIDGATHMNAVRHKVFLPTLFRFLRANSGDHKAGPEGRDLTG